MFVLFTVGIQFFYRLLNYLIFYENVKINNCWKPLVQFNLFVCKSRRNKKSAESVNNVRYINSNNGGGGTLVGARGGAVSTVYVFPTDDEAADGGEDEEEEDENDEEPTFREKFQVWLLKFIDTFCVWNCGWPWLKFQQGLAFIVFDPFVELYITLCIVVNTLFMALDHHEMDPKLDFILNKANVVSARVYGRPRITFRKILAPSGFVTGSFPIPITSGVFNVLRHEHGQHCFKFVGIFRNYTKNVLHFYDNDWQLIAFRRSDPRISLSWIRHYPVQETNNHVGPEDIDFSVPFLGEIIEDKKNLIFSHGKVNPPPSLYVNNCVKSHLTDRKSWSYTYVQMHNVKT